MTPDDGELNDGLLTPVKRTGERVGTRDGAVVVDIVADVREQPSATFAVLASRSDVALTIATLKFGDYSVAAQLSFERKTAEDLGRSIIDGRLFRQVSALRYRVDRPILLVEGLQAASSPAGVPWHAMRGALVSVAAVFAVPILFSQSATICSGVMPPARYSSTSYTVMRRPRMHGFPPRLPGSIVMMVR